MKPAAAPPKIALFLRLAYTGSRAECRGILDYAREHGPWHVLLQEGRLGEQLLDLRRLGIAGAIAECPSPEEVALIASLRVPVVLLEDPAPAGRRPRGSPLSSAPCVRMDSRAVGRMAAEYYLARGYRHFAYVDETLGLFWSRERHRGFFEAVRAAGFPCDFYGGPFPERERASWAAERPRMIRFLRALPRPTAILAAMDGRARLVLEACSAAGCSRRHLETRFRQLIGTTIREMAQRERIERVKGLLEQGNLPIGEIAALCGFADNSDLSILFRRITGTTMRDWRRENRESHP